MSYFKIDEDFKNSKTVSGKGFYLTLIASLILIGSTLWVVMNKSIDNVVDKNVTISKKIAKKHNEKSKIVNNTVYDVPIKKKAASTDFLAKNKNIEKLPNADTKYRDQQTTEENKLGENQSTNINIDEKVLFILPFSGPIVKNYSNNELVKNETLGHWCTHDGIDIKGNQGDPVRISADGVISKTYEDPLWGTCVEASHANNISTYYYGLNKKLNVKEGMQVEAGQIIGSIGKGISCEQQEGLHVHFGMKEKDIWIDPGSKIVSEQIGQE